MYLSSVMNNLSITLSFFSKVTLYTHHLWRAAPDMADKMDDGG